MTRFLIRFHTGEAVRCRPDATVRRRNSLLNTVVYLAVVQDRRYITTDYITVISRTSVNYSSWYVLNSHCRLILYVQS
jgi:hypothetical protein